MENATADTGGCQRLTVSREIMGGCSTKRKKDSKIEKKKRKCKVYVEYNKAELLA